MRIISLLLFIFFSNISSSQNSLDIYKSALEIMKSSKEFDSFLTDFDAKQRDFSVSDITYPICVYSETFVDYINPCKSNNWLETWPKEKIENLETLGNKRNKKIVAGFTNTEKKYFVIELTIKSSKKSQLYLFEQNDNKATLLNVANK